MVFAFERGKVMSQSFSPTRPFVVESVASADLTNCKISELLTSSTNYFEWDYDYFSQESGDYSGGSDNNRTTSKLTF